MTTQSNMRTHASAAHLPRPRTIGCHGVRRLPVNFFSARGLFRAVISMRGVRRIRRLAGASASDRDSSRCDSREAAADQRACDWISAR